MKPKSIPSESAKNPRGKIPHGVSTLNDRKYYCITMLKYNENLCELELFEKNKHHACWEAFKRITKATLGNLREQNIDRIPIAPKGDYLKLYNRLPQGIELF